MRFRRRRAPRSEEATAAGTDVGWASAVGPRADNQDRCFVAPDLAVVSDGMGGYRGGARAAALSVDAAVAALRTERSDDPPARLHAAFARANGAVRAARAADPAVAEMGATLTVALEVGSGADGRRWAIAHVGDSPAFVVRADEAAALTADHTPAAELVAAGVLTEAQAATHPGRHLLLRSIGHEPDVDADVTEVALREGDALVLGSDGLSGVLDAGAIGAIVRASTTADRAASALVDTAVERGATDNVTAVVVRQVPSSTA